MVEKVSLFTDEEIKKILEDSQDEIRTRLIEGIKDHMVRELTWSINESLDDIVKKFFDEEIAPEVCETLIGQKGVILEAFVQRLNEAIKAVAEAIVQDATENLGTSYRRRNLMNALLQGL